MASTNKEPVSDASVPTEAMSSASARLLALRAAIDAALAGRRAFDPLSLEAGCLPSYEDSRLAVALEWLAAKAVHLRLQKTPPDPGSE